MRLLILAVGRCREGPERDLYDYYADRLSHGRPLGPVVLREVEERRALPAERLKLREAELLYAAVPAGARLVALDERGRALDSLGFARQLGCWRDEGVRETVFVIGGAHGLASDLKRRADMVLALGTMTWPHMLVRGLLAEQVYRAACILEGHPYHRA